MKDTLLKCHHDERPPCWNATSVKDHPVEMPPQWKTTLLKCHPGERPPCWNATPVKDHPVEMSPWWKITLLKCHPDERPPRWNAILLEMPPYWNAIPLKDYPYKSPPCWKATPTKEPVKCHPRWNVSLMMCCIRHSSRVNSCFCELFSLQHNPLYLTWHCFRHLSRVTSSNLCAMFFCLQCYHLYLTATLFQTFVKGYLITFVRLLLGIDAEEGSGHLSSVSHALLALNKLHIREVYRL